jgi:hypothetical protein
MRNEFESASGFRERAAECVRLAELASDTAARRDYCLLANCYILLARWELGRVDGGVDSFRGRAALDS